MTMAIWCVGWCVERRVSNQQGCARPEQGGDALRTRVPVADDCCACDSKLHWPPPRPSSACYATDHVWHMPRHRHPLYPQGHLVTVTLVYEQSYRLWGNPKPNPNPNEFTCVRLDCHLLHKLFPPRSFHRSFQTSGVSRIFWEGRTKPIFFPFISLSIPLPFSHFPILYFFPFRFLPFNPVWWHLFCMNKTAIIATNPAKVEREGA